jgi:hypothetical protein
LEDDIVLQQGDQTTTPQCIQRAKATIHINIKRQGAKARGKTNPRVQVLMCGRLKQELSTSF